MAKKKSERLLGVLAVVVGIPIFLVNWVHDKIGIPPIATYAALVLAAGLGLFIYFREQNQKFQAIKIANVDSMSGIEFERYLQRLLTTQGYSVRITQASGDLGVDLVASRNGDLVAIQVKRYNAKISRRAISDAVAGMQHYRCNKSMVITNSYFTPGAIILARSTNCILADRNTLTQWIIAHQKALNRNA